MSHRLQEFGWKESQYARPSQTWVCGRAVDGAPCRLGPNSAGRCPPGRFECEPVLETRKVDGKPIERWVCTRSEHDSCEDGPAPDGTCSRSNPTCQPVRSLRSKRGALVVWTTLTTAVLLVVILSSPRARIAFLSPGALSAQHAAAFGDSESESCIGCHAEARTWLGAGVAASNGDASMAPQSAKCRACHDLGEHAMFAHGADPTIRTATKAETARGQSTYLALARAVSNIQPERELACATCHREHHGRDASLTEMTNAQCQVCHQTVFESLAEGHPDFRLGDRDTIEPAHLAWSDGRVTTVSSRGGRLRFTHRTHAARSDVGHWKCTACHVLDSTGAYVTVKPFRESCALCHTQHVQGRIRFLSGLKLVRTAEGDKSAPAKLQLSHQAISPFTELLLLGDAEYEKPNDIIKDLEILRNAPETNAANLDAVKKRVLLAVKSLFGNPRSSGESERKIRLRRALELPDREKLDIEALYGHLSTEQIKTAADEWLKPWSPPTRGGPARRVKAASQPVKKAKESLREMKQEHRSGLLLQHGLAEVSSVREIRGHWARVESGDAESEKDLSIVYRSYDHADPFIRAWLELVSPWVESPDAPRAAKEIFRVLAGGLHDSEGRSGDKDPYFEPPACMMCHTYQFDGRGGQAVNWKPGPALGNLRPLTFFSHAPHLKHSENDGGCTTCHVPASGNVSQVGRNRDFETISKRACVSCHVPDGAGDRCLKCHNYHGGALRWISRFTDESKEFHASRPRESRSTLQEVFAPGK